MNSILFGDTMVPIIEQDYNLFLGIVFYIRNIILLGSTTKKHYSYELESKVLKEGYIGDYIGIRV